MGLEPTNSLSIPLLWKEKVPFELDLVCVCVCVYEEKYTRDTATIMNKSYPTQYVCVCVVCARALGKLLPLSG